MYTIPIEYMYMCNMVVMPQVGVKNHRHCELMVKFHVLKPTGIPPCFLQYERYLLQNFTTLPMCYNLLPYLAPLLKFIQRNIVILP